MEYYSPYKKKPWAELPSGFLANAKGVAIISTSVGVLTVAAVMAAKSLYDFGEPMNREGLLRLFGKGCFFGAIFYFYMVKFDLGPGEAAGCMAGDCWRRRGILFFFRR